jgi:hypothetical protein
MKGEVISIHNVGISFIPYQIDTLLIVYTLKDHHQLAGSV